MGKRKTKSGGIDSAESTPYHSDNDDEPPNKKSRTKKEQKTSEELCAELGVVDVDLEYTDADFQNLTTYSFFMRMVRPQLTAVNSRMASSKMSSILEAKWREFQEANPYNKTVEIMGDSSSEEDTKDGSIGNSRSAGSDMYDDEASHASTSPRSTRSHRGRSRNRSQRTTPSSSMPPSEEDVSDEEPRSKVKGRQSTGSLKVKLPMTFGLRKSAREKKQTKVMSDREFDHLIGSDAETISDTDDSSSDATPRRHSNKSSRKSRESSASKTRKRKQYTPEASDFDDSDDDDTSDDVDDSASDDFRDSRRRAKSRRKKSTKPERVRIPGERKSGRMSTGMTKEYSEDISKMTDKEFEKMLREEEKEKQKRKCEAESAKKKRELEKKKEEKRRKKQEQERELDKKGYWQGKDKPDAANKEGGESGNESDHFWYCEICKDGGDLMLCDTCPKSYHQECLKLDIVPEGDWSCPVCTGEGLPEEGDSSEEEEEEEHEQFCKVCKEGGDVILCDFCSCVYHMKCLNPPMIEVPEGEWKCPRCKVQEKPLKAKVVKILTWRWDHQLQGTDETDHTQSPEKKAQIRKSLEESDKKMEKKPERELFVRFMYHSYWDCEWISELSCEIFQPLLLISFRNKFDQNEPPALEDGSSFGKLRHKGTDTSDPYKLEDRYFRYGIKPEWLQIHRIIHHDGKGKELRYLVKWRDLPYLECTWEFCNELPEGLQDWDKHVDIYNNRRKERLKIEEFKKKKDKPKKSLWKKKLEKQPDYISETGGTLHPYQLEGLNWLRFSYAQDTNTILADEMGLGKTIQSIAFLRALYKENFCTSYPFIITAPLSTVPNWEREFEFWAPDLYVVTYAGSRENRAVIREREFCYKEGAFHNLTKAGRMKEGYRPKFDVLLTSYEMVSVDSTTLSSIEWGAMVVDEAHRLKNNQSLFFRTLSEYKLHYKLLLTGTPLQNNLEELFHLLNFLEPGKFDDLESFLDEFAEIGRDEQVSKLHEMLAPHMLRRLKMDVLTDMPSKTELIVRIELSPMQKKFYKHVLTKNYTALNVRGHSNVTSLSNIMMDLRKTCNHPYLFPSAEQDAPLTRGGQYEGSALTKASGKMELLVKMLGKLKKDNHRVLIFSQMTRNLDLMEDFLDYHKYGFERIDGSIMGHKRQEAIDRFNSTDSKSFVFLLSTRAGGLGINLATADTVIIYDMDWNPHNDIQAFSRAHRIGQKNKVMIYRFVCRNTVEEKIAQVCKKKMMLSELVVHKGMGSVAVSEKKESLTKQEISDILKFGAEDLFKDDDTGKLVYDDAAVEKLMDRDVESELAEEEEDAETKGGMNEYLRSFKVASYQLKEGAEEEEEEEEPSTSTADQDTEAVIDAASEISTRRKAKIKEPDQDYWDRVLRDSYQEHVVNIIQEQEAIAQTLGKGKRVRKQINYQERDMSIKITEDKTKKKVVSGKEEEYEPSSSDETESESEAEEPDETEVMDAAASTAREQKLKAKAIKKQQRELKKQQRQGEKKVELPPLLTKIGHNNIEVLGFTARQRRSFLDTVMRYGMPPEDAYRSQWLVRDLRHKTERIFRAYVSLFMRHLCEPVAENAENFADGVPKEGLSRKHVLTRIGIIALIRRKVNEFEKINGTDSLQLYIRKPHIKIVTFVENAGSAKTGETAESAKQGEASGPVKMDLEVKSIGENSAGKTDSSGVNNSEGMNKGSGGEKDDVAENKTEAETKKTDCGSAEHAESEKPESDDSGKEKERKVEEMEVDNEKTEEKHEDREKEEKKREAEEKGEEKKNTEKENNEAKSSDGRGGESQQTDCSNTDNSEERKQENEGKADKTPEEKKDEKQEQAADKDQEKGTEKANASEDPVPDWQTLTADEISDHLRKYLWIADGGFTDLHGIWAVEERYLKKGNETEHWHRVHDFWLLTGVITHGYRHWQEILFDPRFQILSRAFRTDIERTRKAAFLNRRFQLLEQALVIEEQLRKASLENPPEVPSSSSPPSKTDVLRKVDCLADKLKSVGVPPPESKTKKVLSQVASLVTDIKIMSMASPPATLLTTSAVPAPSPLRMVKPHPSGVMTSVMRPVGAPSPANMPPLRMQRPPMPHTPSSAIILD